VLTRVARLYDLVAEEHARHYDEPARHRNVVVVVVRTVEPGRNDHSQHRLPQHQVHELVETMD
jgi:hypothetical protein